MAREAFTDAKVVELSEQFVCVLIDGDKEPAVAQEYGVAGFPTVQFVAPGGRRLNQAVGKKSAGELIGEMRQALRAVQGGSGPT